MRRFLVPLTLLLVSFAACYAFAQDVVSPEDFLTQVLSLIKGFGGLPWAGKISGIVLLLVASMKVSFLKPFWDKIGAAQAWIAPVLGLIVGVVSLATSGKITLPALFAYLAAGAGAVLLHELLDTIKAIPGIGAIYVTIINFIEGLLGGGNSTPPPPAVTASVSK